MKRNESKQRGITLVSLVITIIVLLILAGVGISLAVNGGGIFEKANLAIEKWNNRIKEEENILQTLEETMGINVNAPELKTGMIAVYYDKGWRKADESSNNWYRYDTVEKQWGNAVTVKENGRKTREEYMRAEVGTAIAEEDILAMFVWIPRYAYNIASGYHTAANGTGEIQIKFLKETTDEYEGGTAVRQVDTNAMTNGNKYVVHPAFTTAENETELKGIWVGKFESSNASSPYNNEGMSEEVTTSATDNLKKGLGDGVTKDVTIRPNVTSWRWTDVVSMYNVCEEMNKSGNIHGLGTDSKTMLMKNSQWGAVAYLAQSNYGNKQEAGDNASGIWNNPYNEGYIYGTNSSYGTVLTGMTGCSRDTLTGWSAKVQTGSKQDNGNSIRIKYNDVSESGTLGNEYERTFYRYNTENGVKGSTTRNIYGVYDMSGGASESMASFLEEGTTTYVTTLKSKAEKTISKYAGSGATSSTEDRTTNYEANKETYGDAVYETSNDVTGNSGWNNDYTNFPILGSPFFTLGGDFRGGSVAGVFCFAHRYGGSNAQSGFRAVAL